MAGIINKAIKEFSDRKPETLRNTVQWNVSIGLPRKGVKIVKDSDGLLKVK